MPVICPVIPVSSATLISQKRRSDRMSDDGIQNMPKMKEGDPGVALLLSAC
jgi:hypothetical protein